MAWQKKVDAAVAKVTGSRGAPGWSDAARDAAAKSKASKIAERTKWEAENKAKNPHLYPVPDKEWIKSHGGKNRYRPKSNAEW